MTASRHRALASGIVVAALLGNAAFAASYPRPGRTELVSVGTGDVQTTASASNPLVTADGRLAFFVTNAANLVPGDTNNNYDVFVRDRTAGTTAIVSLTHDGAPIAGYALSPEVTPDGRFGTFSSGARNVVPGDTNNVGDIFVVDRLTGSVERASLAHDDGELVWGSGGSAISDDGRFVSFATGAPNAVPEKTNNGFDVYVRDLVEGTTERASVGTDGAESNAESYWHHLSGDGRRVAIDTFASTLVPGDTNGVQDVVIRDRIAGTTVRASVASDGAQGNGTSNGGHLDHHGRHVAFASLATNLVPADANLDVDVFVHDLETGRTERVSVTSEGGEGNAGSFAPRISTDGRYVAFQSHATNLVDGDTNGTSDTFIHDRVTGRTERVSVAGDGSEGFPTGNPLNRPAVSPDGRYVAFGSSAPALVPGDDNGVSDVFVRDRGPEIGVGDLEVGIEGGDIRASGWATFSGARVAEAADPADDGAQIGAVGARDAGGELTGASVTLRPEADDLLVRWDLAHLPGVRAPPAGIEVSYAGSRSVPSAAGVPGVVYGLAFEIDGARYELRGTKPGVALFRLLRCAPACEEIAQVRGSIGTAGVDARAAIPLQAVGNPLDATLTAVRAFAELGDGPASGAQPLDSVDLPDSNLPRPEVGLGLAHRDTSSDDVDLDVSAAVAGGRFDAGVPLGDRDPAEHVLWVRSCLGADCHIERHPLPNG